MVARTYKDCFAAASAAAGRDLSDQELERVFMEAQRRMNRYVRTGMPRRDAAEAAGRDAAAEAKLAGVLERRNAAINVLRRQELDARATPGEEARAVRQVLTGDQSTARDAGRSIDAERHGIAAQLLGPLVAGLRKAGLLKALAGRDRAFDADVARELWRLETPDAAEPTGNSHAAATAKLLHEAQETARAMQNEAGAWIGKTEHYITRQTHDQMKVRGDGSPAAYRAWRDVITKGLDERTFDRLENPADPVAREKLLHDVWSNLASGVHEISDGSTLGGFVGPGNLAKKVSAERVLHFASADGWLEYNAQFGHGGVIDGVAHGIERAARDVALMRTLGTNPEAMYRGWVDAMQAAARDRGDFQASDKLDSEWNERILDTVTGKSNLPGHAWYSSIGRGIRATQSLAKLGGVVLSSIPDVAVNASMLRHNGIGLFESYGRQVVSLLPKDAGSREVADTLGVGIDGMLGHIANRFRAEDGPLGRMSRTVELFHRATLLTWWTDSLKQGAGLMLSNNLGRNAEREFASLPARLQTTLTRYGIQAAEWDAIRPGAAQAADGAMHLLPDSIADPLLRTKLQTYITDQVREGMTEPTAGDRTLATWGTKAGTFGGELVRLLMQFKTYPVTFMQRTLVREFSRDGLDIAGVAHLIVATSLLGYASMTLKEVFKGREPRKPENAAGYGKAVLAAMLQGGGLGIYGDFLFGEANRFGGGFGTSLMGPTVGTLDDASKLFAAIRDGVIKRDMGHTAGEALQLAKNNAPLINLFYTRAALDHLIFFRLQEAANPGYLARYERRVKHENNQDFWWRPTSAVR